MRKVCSLLFGPLIMLTGISPVWADGVPVKAASEVVNVVRGGTVALEATNSSSFALRAIGAMRQSLVGTATLAEAYAKTPTIAAGIARREMGIYGPLKVGWATKIQARSAMDLRDATLALDASQAARLLLKDSAELEGLSEDYISFLMLANYPAVAVEGPTVLGQVQVERALAYYQKIIVDTSISSKGGNAFKDWGQCMSAVTNIGLFSTAESADLIIDAATKVNYGILTGPTDIITTRALLNLKAYGKIQKLADIRLKAVDGNGNPMMLPYEWGEIQKYMQEAGLELNIPQNRIAPVPEKPVLSRMPTAEGWLGYYNAYNLFAADPSAETTANFMQLRKAMEEKAAAIKVKQSLSREVSAK